MFDSIVHRYDLANDLLSLGLDRWWRRAAARAISPGPGDAVLDLGCGTGRLGELVAASGARVVGVDVSRSMLVEARRRLGRRMAAVQASAFRLPFAEAAFAGAVSGFVLRNLDDLPAALGELARVLRPGARAALVDITEPRNLALRRGFDAYFRVAAPAVGSLIGRREAYSYLVRSLAHLPPPEEVAEMLRHAGFDPVLHRALAPGMVTLWTARRA